MIYHVFYGNQIKHIGNFIRRLKEYSVLDHFYFIICKKEQDKEDFLSFFEKNDIKNYKLFYQRCNSNLANELFYSRIWFYFLKEHRRDTIVFHGGTLRCCLSLLLLQLGAFQRVNWVNWGYVKYLRKIKGGFLRNIAYRIRNYLLLNETQSFNIIALMDPDKRILKTYNPKAIKCIPYPMWSLSDTVFFKNDINNNVILLGNSRWYIKSYIELIEKLPQCESMNYIKLLYSYGPIPKKSDEEKLIHLLDNKFEKNYYLIKDFMSLEKYYEMIKDCTCYVCNHDGQTGLGAIYSAILIGRDIFVRGSNILWTRKMGLKVFSINDFINEYPLLPRLSIEDAQKNRNRLISFLDPQRIISLWDEFLSNPIKQ